MRTFRRFYLKKPPLAMAPIEAGKAPAKFDVLPGVLLLQRSFKALIFIRIKEHAGRPVP
jgi:hypothetical protein